MLPPTEPFSSQPASALAAPPKEARLAKCAKKVILLGHFGVGKSSLVQRFVHSIFSAEYHTTIGVNIDKKVVLTPTHEMKMVLWDIEGAPDQTRLPRSYFMGAHGIIYVCDVTRPNTFKDLHETLPQLNEKSPNASVIVIGNKVDLLREDQLTDLQDPENPRFDFLSSANTGQHVEAAFETLAQKILTP